MVHRSEEYFIDQEYIFRIEYDIKNWCFFEIYHL